MPVLSENLIAYYQCEDFADSWGSRTGTPSSISIVTGLFGDCWEYSSDSDDVVITITPDVSTWTVAAWGFDLDGFGYRALCTNNQSSSNGSYHMLISNSDELGVWSNNTFTGSGVTINAASYTGWHHYAATRDSGGIVRFYIDGAYVGQCTPSSWPGSNGVASLGNHGSFNERWADKIDDFAIWNRTLDASEITTIYNEGNSGNSLRSLIGPSTLRGQFASVVHTVAPENGRLHGQFASVVHTVDAENGRLHGMFASVVHSVPPPAAIVPDITGAPGVPATFDGSASTLVEYYQWRWVSVPGGSPLRAPFDNGPVPFPDSQATSPIDMTNNQGLWHFEGNANDTSGNSRNGTVTGASLVAGKVGAQAYQFGVADNINFGAASTFISADFSISLWLKGDAAWTPSVFDAIVGASNAFSWSEGFGAFWLNATAIRFFVGDYNTDFVDLTVTPGDWNHIVFTWDGSTIKGYLNGSEVATKAHSSALTGLANDFFASQLGTYGNGEQTIDELAIWSRVLSTSEVSTIYTLQNGGLAGIGTSTFTFTPDIVGTYTINLAIDGSTNSDADCVVTAPGGGGSEPQGHATQGGSLQGRRTQGLL